ncbi:MAG: hypothetical protein AUJ01_08970 [Acidobacteria bacterium 13_1_40CM_3_65_5]|nr:MAG: hypothetical protein AUJ01_08970 [Acidobacteria bacterium 13_1_40CM_3_65_5]
MRFFCTTRAIPTCRSAATIGREILLERPETGVIYVPVGDSALIRGVASAAKHLRPASRIVGVVTERAPAYYLSWQRGRVVETASADTIADGLAVRRPLAPNVAAIGELVDEMRLGERRRVAHGDRVFSHGTNRSWRSPPRPLPWPRC